MDHDLNGDDWLEALAPDDIEDEREALRLCLPDLPLSGAE